MSPSIIEHIGPGPMPASSTIVSPESGPAMVSLLRNAHLSSTEDVSRYAVAVIRGPPREGKLRPRDLSCGIKGPSAHGLGMTVLLVAV